METTLEVAYYFTFSGLCRPLVFFAGRAYYTPPYYYRKRFFYMLETILALVTLLLAASGTAIIAQRVKLPYTVLLVIVGIFLIPLADTTLFGYLHRIKLTPELLFYVLLPVLIFESAYNMNMRRMMANIRSISLLSILSLLLSAAAVAVGLYYGLSWIGFPIPWSVSILFGALISATDPVAVLALFKEYGAPKRLALIFEGESLFNDGTSLALFLVVLEIAVKGSGIITAGALGDGVLMFGSMIVGGVVLGTLFGFVFSKLIEKIEDNSALELTLALVMAHVTFLSSEVLNHWLTHHNIPLGISSIIATTAGAITIGNWGRYKISSRVHDFMEHTLGYFAFLVNSVVFLLIGFLFTELTIPITTLLVPSLIVVAVVAVARAFSVYSVVGALNVTKTEAYISRAWQHLLAWGSLRGALAVSMVLLIPTDWRPEGWTYAFSPAALITAFTIVCIYFTLFAKATTIGAMLERFRLTKMNAVEYAGYLVGRERIANTTLAEVDRFLRRGYIDEELASRATRGYARWKERAYMRMRETCQEFPEAPTLALDLHVIGIEAYALHRLYHYKEISELVYRKLHSEIDIRLMALEENKHPEISTACEIRFSVLDIFETWMSARDRVRNHYLFARARIIAGEKVLEALARISEDHSMFDPEEVARTRVIYTERIAQARMHFEALLSEHDTLLAVLREKHLEEGLLKAKESALEEIITEGLVASKAAQRLAERIAVTRTDSVA